MTSSKNRGYSFCVKNVKILGYIDIFCITYIYIPRSLHPGGSLTKV